MTEGNKVALCIITSPFMMAFPIVAGFWCISFLFAGSLLVPISFSADHSWPFIVCFIVYHIVGIISIPVSMWCVDIYENRVGGVMECGFFVWVFVGIVFYSVKDFIP